MSSRDVNGVIRGACSECECKEFLSGEKVRCATCDHVPNKHSAVTQSIENKPVITQNPTPLVDTTLPDNYGLMCTDISTNPFSTISLTQADEDKYQVEFATPQCHSLPVITGDTNSNIDVRGVARYSCSNCDCAMYQRPAQGAKCVICSHPPIKHSTGPSSQQISPALIQPLQSLNNFEESSKPTHSEISAKVNITPAPSLTGSVTPSHHVMTSFTSDPPNAVSVSADNSLVVPTDQPVKITIEINMVPVSK